jgi:hypothetical protein
MKKPERSCIVRVYDGDPQVLFEIEWIVVIRT